MNDSEDVSDILIYFKQRFFPKNYFLLTQRVRVFNFY